MEIAVPRNSAARLAVRAARDELSMRLLELAVAVLALAGAAILAVVR